MNYYLYDELNTKLFTRNSPVGAINENDNSEKIYTFLYTITNILSLCYVTCTFFHML